MRVVLGLGANLHKPLSHLRSAIGQLSTYLSPLQCSFVYRSAPVGHLEQPEFLNLIAIGRTGVSPAEVLRRMGEIEENLGRVRSFPNAPRTIDIDLLAYGDLVLDTRDLILPHPRLHQRAFVLVPLLDIAPEWRHPVFGKTAAELLSAAGALERIERVGPLPD